MQLERKIDSQTRALIMAMGGAAIAAIAAMFVPTAIWETVTGSTGISEMIPATAAPLGDTARALMAFGIGALAFAILAALLLRRTPAVPKKTAAPVEADIWDDDDDAGESQPSLIVRLREKIAAFVAARRGSGEISNLEDLPKLRAGDAHPDAPPRRPFSAGRDLAEPMLEAELPAAEPVEEAPVLMAAAQEPVTEAEWAEVQEIPDVDPEPIAAEPANLLVEEEYAPIEPSVAAKIGSDFDDDALAQVVPQDWKDQTLASMISRLESAMSERDNHLAQIAALATALPPHQEAEVPHAAPVETAIAEPEEAPMVSARPALEAIRNDTVVEMPIQNGDIDPALRSALETLHRMNARNR